MGEEVAGSVVGSDRSFRDSAQQARPHPRRAQHTTWVASWSRGARERAQVQRERGLTRRPDHVRPPRPRNSRALRREQRR